MRSKMTLMTTFTGASIFLMRYWLVNFLLSFFILWLIQVVQYSFWDVFILYLVWPITYLSMFLYGGFFIHFTLIILLNKSDLFKLSAVVYSLFHIPLLVYLSISDAPVIHWKLTLHQFKWDDNWFRFHFGCLDYFFSARDLP